MTSLDRNTPPLSVERLTEIRALPYHAEVHLLEQVRVGLLSEVDRLNAYVNSIDRLNEIADADWKQEVDRLKAQVRRLEADAKRDEHTTGQLIDERDNLHALLDKFAEKVAPLEVIGEHSSGNDPWLNAMDLVTPAAEVDRLRAAVELLGTELQRGSTAFTDRLRQLAAERDQARESAKHLAGALAKVGVAVEQAMRLAAAGDAAGAAAVLGDVASEEVAP
ncbi:hypothetical protein FXF51_05760 [Nonomuraea sp. PA05]|uniref:hypothetical protein n=1 Tax=Nonomuraea sp. PA05 TaxID=2604466 RepID=UPI0011D9B2E6|nr:hypothetical protein [Nonomuraea sp. PA05]TYB69666.1 hypothetical protein FXF51_05760 [Nonomuraea sp. PA05]